MTLGRVAQRARVFVGACILLASVGGEAGVAHAQATAVLSSQLGPYREALAGFQQDFSGKVQTVELSEGKRSAAPSGQLIVAIGGRATHERYSDRTPLVFCMAPGTDAPGNRHAPTVRVHMLPAPATLLVELRRLQPGVKTIGVLWVSDGFDAYTRRLEEQAQRLRLRIRVERMRNASELPDRLRRLSRDGVEALWVPPDPQLLGQENFVVLRTFSRANRVPLYVPTRALVEKGAVAAVACSFRDVGRAAARAANELMRGVAVDSETYPEASEIVVNPEAARACGLILSPEVLSRAVRVGS